MKRQRDRDEQGRAQNARPRDGLGRPLPHGSEGVERIPEDIVRPPEQSLSLSRELFAAGKPFHAHEVLEGAWKSAPEAERGLWKALAQLAVGITHLRRGNPKGAVSLLTRARDGIQPHAEDPPHGIRAAELVAYADELAARIERQGVEDVPLDDLNPPLGG